MATNGYTTAAEAKRWLGITDANDDTILDELIDSASRWIDYHCRRQFYTSAAETRYFTALDSDLVLIDDLDAITSLKTDDNNDGTFETTWASTDYVLEPFSKKVRGIYHPYTVVHITDYGSKEFPTWRRGVEIVGTFGWSSVPHPVRDACRLLVARYFKRKDAPLASLGNDPFSAQDVPVRDADVVELLAPFVAGPVIG